jgi:large conductance mechanosensitive channel
MSFAKEFREFALKGNVVDMAVGVIIGGAFGKIVSSLVADVLMPPIGKIVGNVDFTSLFVPMLKPGATAPASLQAAKDAGVATINYGVFLQTVFDFAIIALVLFMVIKAVNRLKRADAAPPAAPNTKDCPECLSAIPLKARRCAHCTAALA